MKIKQSPSWKDMNDALKDLGKPKPKPSNVYSDYFSGGK